MIIVSYLSRIMQDIQNYGDCEGLFQLFIDKKLV